jgi:5-methylcytosine-specific restriction endonuclease McrA
MMTREEKAAYNRAYHLANKEKAVARTRAWRAADPDRAKALDRAVYEKSTAKKSEQSKARYVEKRFELLAKNRAWRIANPHLVKANVIKYETQRAVATPPWADTDALKAVYLEAQRLREQGRDVHVDHIIPLQGKKVSGLHVPSNLQILSAKANLAKGNKILETA